MEHQLKFAGSKLAKSTNRIPASHGSLRTATDQRRKDLGWIREPLRRRAGTRCGCTGARSVWGLGGREVGLMPSKCLRASRLECMLANLDEVPGWYPPGSPSSRTQAGCPRLGSGCFRTVELQNLGDNDSPSIGW
jgi:hypothetical protein